MIIKMAHKRKLIMKTIILMLIQVVLSVEDLLDQYVNHVDSVNKLPQNNINEFNLGYNNNNKNKLNQRYKRQIKNNFDLEALKSPISRKIRDVTGYDTKQWTHSEVLDRDGRIILRWQPRHQEILFRVEAKTKGYVGIGFSPDGGMEGADIVLGWVDDKTTKAYLLDCHGVSKSQGSAPIRDEIDNYTLMRGIQNDTHTILEFRRVLDTCDPDDYILSGDTVRVIWALHKIDPQIGAEMVYHGDKRGSQSVHLLGPPPTQKNEPPTHIRQWDVTLKNFEIKNNMNTIYWCKIFKAPTLQQKHHIIGYEPLIGENHTNFVHHMLLHECDLDSTANILKWDSYSKENGKNCYGNDMPVEWEKCLTPLVAWAVGSKGENLPKHVGLPLADRTPSYYMLEIHFDNPSMKKTIDTTGLRLHFTNRLRENDGGILVTGVALSTLHFIPPMQPEYKSAGYCSMACTKEILPREGVNVVSVLLHSHLAGRKLKLRHIRGGKELPPIAQDNHYDFNYQQSRALSHETTILPGDGLVTECTYSTLKRNRPTLGGYSTNEEMCLAFVLHYPRTTLAGCYSMPPISYFFHTIGVKEFYGKNMTEVERMFLQGTSETTTSAPTPTPPLFPYTPGDEMSPEANRRAIIALQNAKDYTIEGESATGTLFDRLIIKEPQEFQNKSFMSHLQNLPYNETLLTKKIEEYFYVGLHLTFCRKRDDTLAMRETIEKFPNFTTYSSNDTKVLCSYKLKSASSSEYLKPNIIFVLFSFYILY